MAVIMIVDDDPTVVDVVRRYLEKDGHSVLTAADGAAGLAVFGEHSPDLVILDVMMPRMSGLDVARNIRRTSEVPIILLTALGDESDRVLGLEIGADDYVTKPFSPRELALRVSSILRRTAGTTPDSGLITDGDLQVDPAARQASRGKADLALTVREFDLLVHFISHPFIAFSREQLLEEVWGWTFGDSSTVTVHVRRLREKIEDNPAEPTRIKTVWGVGYRYESTTRLEQDGS